MDTSKPNREECTLLWRVAIEGWNLCGGRVRPHATLVLDSPVYIVLTVLDQLLYRSLAWINTFFSSQRSSRADYTARTGTNAQPCPRSMPLRRIARTSRKVPGGLFQLGRSASLHGLPLGTGCFRSLNVLH